MPRFDQVVDLINDHLRKEFRDDAYRAIIVREVTGSATVVLPDDSLSNVEAWNRLAATLDRELGIYSPGPREVLLRHSDLIEPRDILESPDLIQLPDKSHLSLIDRLLTNQDWLRSPVATQSPLPTATAYSIKGGVGRSTAFAMLAWYLARLGKRVLVVDLDLEAPGMGSLLLQEMPDLGLVDWFVEALAGQPDEVLLQEIQMPSPLDRDTPGSIRVIPAFGVRTQGYVAKLGRIYTPSITSDGTPLGFADRLARLIEHAQRQLEPLDVVLLDARAGLHDIGAAAVTQIGAEVFLFGRDDPPSWDAYAQLFDHLRMARSVRFGMSDEDLRWRMKMVAAQLDPTENALKRWTDAAYSTWTQFYDDDGAGEDAQTFMRADEAAPHHPLPITFDSRIRGLSLIDPDNRPDWNVVEAAFGRFLKGASERLFDGADGASTRGVEP
jgi:cellulose biosynthesis protein BcsQ